jgi:hypothetical protein
MKRENRKKQMKEIARKMANYFLKYITVPDLIWWLGEANDFIYTQHTEGNETWKESGANDFTSSLGWGFLPGLAKCKSEKEMNKFLETELPHLFGWRCLDGSKSAICEIGACYFIHFNKYTTDEEDTRKFMGILSTFMELLAIYEEYEFLQKEMLNEEAKMIKAA